MDNLCQHCGSGDAAGQLLITTADLVKAGGSAGAVCYHSVLNELTEENRPIRREKMALMLLRLVLVMATMKPVCGPSLQINKFVAVGD
jgi:hypothetical protein